MRLLHPYHLLLKTLLLVLILSFLVEKPVHAQAEDVQFDHLTIEDGLSQNTIQVFLQDHRGYLWIGTEDGLNQYDGYEFTVYRYEAQDSTALSASNIQALYEDSLGGLWVGTTTGLDRFDRSTGKFLRIHIDQSAAVTTINETVDGVIWAGTDGQGIWVVDPKTNTMINRLLKSADPDSLSSNHIHQIYRDHLGTLWAATEGGLDQCVNPKGAFQHYRRNLADPNSLSNNNVTAIREDRDGYFWIGTWGGGLNRYDPRTHLFTFFLPSSVDQDSISSGQISGLLEDSRGDLWIATGYGLNLLRRGSSRFDRFVYNSSDPTSLKGSQVNCLYEDRSGVLWIGMENAGINQYKPYAHKFPVVSAHSSPTQAVRDASVTAVAVDAGVWWFGTGELGLNRFDPQSGTWQVYQHEVTQPNSLSSNSISALAPDGKGGLWIGMTGSGLDHFDPQLGIFTHFRYDFSDPGSLRSNTAASLLVDHAGRLWVGTADAGLYRLEESSKQFLAYRHDPQNPNSISSDRVTALAEDAQGRIWVGTDQDGLNQLDPVTGTVIRYRAAPGGLQSDAVAALAFAPDSALWIGTDQGLDRFDPSVGGSGDFRHYSTQNGLPGDTVTCIVPDGIHPVWVSTTNGLAQVSPTSGAVRAFTAEDGLQSREFLARACIRSPWGEAAFGGVRGMNIFFPEAVPYQQVPPPVRITAFQNYNQTVLTDLAENEHIQLTYQDDFIAFEVAALDYNAPAKNQYAYQLVGFDKDWIDAGTRRFISYTNLPSGSYELRVKAANSDGTWNETGTSIRLTITPPFWETGWFRALFGFGIMGALVGGYRLRVAQIEARNRALERRVAELSEEVRQGAIANERSRMARNLHDSVSQSLYSLTLLAEAGLRALEGGDLVQGQEYQARLGEIAQQALQEMRLMVYQLRLPTLEETGLVGALEHRLEAVERRAGVQGRLIVQGNLNLSPSVEEELYYLAQEALNNALKHAGAGSVTVTLQQSGDCLTLAVQDDGRGFNPEQAKKTGGMGLVSMRERAEKLGGALEISSQPGQGTTVIYSGEVRGKIE